MSGSDAPIAVIQVNIEEQAGYYYVTSNDIPGLHLWGEDRDRLCNIIIPAIKILYKKNRNLDVEVKMAADPQTFPEPAAVGLCERFVLYQPLAA